MSNHPSSKRWSGKPTEAMDGYPCQDEAPDSRARLGSQEHLSRQGPYLLATVSRLPLSTVSTLQPNDIPIELPTEPSCPPMPPPRKRRADLQLESQALRMRLQDVRRQQLEAERLLRITAVDDRRHDRALEQPDSLGKGETQSWREQRQTSCSMKVTNIAPAPSLDCTPEAASIPLSNVTPVSYSLPLLLLATSDAAPEPSTSPPMKPPTAEEDEVADYELSPEHSGPSSPVPPSKDALEETDTPNTSPSDSIEVNLSAGDDIPWVTSGCMPLTLRDIQHDTHQLTLRTTSCQSGRLVETHVQHETHDTLVDNFVRTDPAGDRHFLTSYRSHADASTVLASLADGTGIIALCLLMSTSRRQSTRSPLTWNLELIHTRITYRAKGFGSALLRCAITQAMRLLPGQISSRPGFHVSNLLTHAGFAQLAPSQNWLYQHLPLTPGVSSTTSTEREPTDLRTDRRICYILSCIQILGGQPGILDWLLHQRWPHFRVGYSLTMLLAESKDQIERPSTCVTLAVLHSYLVRQNKCMRGHSRHGTEDQDGFDLLLALLTCLDRELGPEVISPLFRVHYEYAGTCAKPSCPDSSSRSESERAISVWVPPSQPAPCRLESLLELAIAEDEREYTCATCNHRRRKYSVAITSISNDVAIHLQRGTCEGPTSHHITPVILPTQLILTVRGTKRLLHLRTVLLLCKVQVNLGVFDPHWITVTHRLLRDKPQNPVKPMWYLASDHYVTPLGNLGTHEANEVLRLEHVTLKRFHDLAICGAFYSIQDTEPSPRSLTPCCNPAYDTPLLDAAIERLRRAGIKVAPCPRHHCTTPAELQARVTSALLTGSPLALKTSYLWRELTDVDVSLRSQRIALTKQMGVKSKTMNFKDSLKAEHTGWGHAEALDGGLQVQSLGGGARFAHELGNQFGVTLTDPAGVVVTTKSYVTNLHFHLLPVLNCGMVIGAGTADGSPWQTVGLYEPQVLKTYLFASVATLELLGLSVKDSGSMDIASLIERAMRLPAHSRKTMQFDWAIMDGKETTHIIFPEQTLHWVATESARRRQTNVVYCGVGSFFLPNDITAARSLRKSIDEGRHSRHTAKQKPSPSEALALLDAHIAALTAPQPPPVPAEGSSPV